jgi:hypothetical protein
MVLVSYGIGDQLQQKSSPEGSEEIVNGSFTSFTKLAGASLGPNASIDRHSPGGVIKGGQAVGDDFGSMDHLQGCVRGRMLRLGQMMLMFFAETRGALDSEGNESAKKTDE